MTTEQAYELLGDGVMWMDMYGNCFMLCGETQDTIPVPFKVAHEMMPRLTHYTRFGQDRWYRADKKWNKVAERYQSVGGL